MSVSTSSTFNPILSDLLNLIGENTFVGTRILPTAPKAVRKGQYPVFDEAVFDNNASKPRQPGSQFARRDTQYGSKDFTCKQYGLENPVADEDANEAEQNGISDVKAAVARQLQRDLMVGHELRVSTEVYSAAFNATAQIGGAMSAADTAKPIVTIQNAVERLHGNGFMENLALIIESSLYNEMINTDEVRSIFNGNGQYTNRQVLLDAFGVQQIIVCPTRYNSRPPHGGAD